MHTHGQLAAAQLAIGATPTTLPTSAHGRLPPQDSVELKPTEMLVSMFCCLALGSCAVDRKAFVTFMARRILSYQRLLRRFMPPQFAARIEVGAPDCCAIVRCVIVVMPVLQLWCAINAGAHHELQRCCTHVARVQPSGMCLAFGMLFIANCSLLPHCLMALAGAQGV